MAQLTGSRSITAAAELSGNLRVWLLLVESAPFEWVGLKFGSRHRLAGLGPAPTETTEVCPVNAVGAGPRPARRRGKSLPYESQESGSGLGRGTPWGSRRGWCKLRCHPHPALRATFPLEGGRRKQAAQCAAPTTENGSGALARQSQAREQNRTRSNFPQTQGPVARKEFRHSLRFCAPEGFCPLQGVTSVSGVRGKRSYGPRRSEAEP